MGRQGSNLTPHSSRHRKATSKAQHAYWILKGDAGNKTSGELRDEKEIERNELCHEGVKKTTGQTQDNTSDMTVQ